MAFKIGTNAAETLRGTNDVDLLDGRGGNDRLFGLAGNDELYGGPGANQIDGGSGSDWSASVPTRRTASTPTCSPRLGLTLPTAPTLSAG